MPPWTRHPPHINQRLEDLRSLCYGHPTERLWRSICRALDRWPDDDTLDLGLEYANQHLSAWPALLRIAPQRWTRSFLSKHHEPRLLVARHLRVEQHPLELSFVLSLERHTHLHNIAAISWLNSPPMKSMEFQHFVELLPKLTHLQHLDFSGTQLSLRSFERLLHTVPHLNALESLDLSQTYLDPTVASLFASQTFPPSLHTLNLSNNPLSSAGLDPILPALTAHPFQHLGLRTTHLDSHNLHTLLDSPLARSLHSLDISRNRLTGSDLNPLTALPQDSPLTTLNLSHNNLGIEGVDALAQTPLNNLTTLNLARTTQRTEELRLLSLYADFPNLTNLNICMNRLSDDGIQALSVATFFPNLVDINLGSNDVDLQTIRTFLHADNPPTPHILDLSFNAIDGACLKLLLSSPVARNLHTLNLEGNNLRASSLEVLQHLPSPLPPLHTLNLSQNDLTTRALRSLARSPLLATIQHLDLSQTHLTDPSALVSSPHTTSLQSLNLCDNPLGPNGLTSLSQARTQPPLTTLLVRRCSLSCASLEALVDSPWITHLDTLDLCDNQLQDAGVTALCRRIPTNTLSHLDLSLNRISEDGAILLAFATSLSQLERLLLHDNIIQKRGLHALETTDILLHLDQITLHGNLTSHEHAEPDQLLLLDL